jgi:hypothetical protein
MNGGKEMADTDKEKIQSGGSKVIILMTLAWRVAKTQSRRKGGLNDSF